MTPALIPAALVAVGTATLGRWEVETVALPGSLADAWNGPALPVADQ